MTKPNRHTRRAVASKDTRPPTGHSVVFRKFLSHADNPECIGVASIAIWADKHVDYTFRGAVGPIGVAMGVVSKAIEGKAKELAEQAAADELANEGIPSAEAP